MSQPKNVIIFGSSRSNGDTRKMVDYLMESGDFDLINLNTKNIGYYDYEHKNQDDDFLPLMENIVEKYETIVFATPVYWYSMSAILKTFFDRITDLLQIRKETGRKLRSMNMAMLSCSMEDDRIETFDRVFIGSADYLGMKYLGDVHTWLKNGAIPPIVKSRLDEFLEKING